MTKPVLEELIEFKAYSKEELEEMNIFELAENFKNLRNEMKRTENKVDSLIERYELLNEIAENYEEVLQKKELEFSDGINYFSFQPGKT